MWVFIQVQVLVQVWVWVLGQVWMWVLVWGGSFPKTALSSLLPSLPLLSLACLQTDSRQSHPAEKDYRGAGPPLDAAGCPQPPAPPAASCPLGRLV